MFWFPPSVFEAELIHGVTPGKYSAEDEEGSTTVIQFLGAFEDPKSLDESLHVRKIFDILSIFWLVFH